MVTDKTITTQQTSSNFIIFIDKQPMGCYDQLESRGFFTIQCPGVKCLEIFPAKVRLGRSFRSGGGIFFTSDISERVQVIVPMRIRFPMHDHVSSCSGYDLDHQV